MNLIEQASADAAFANNQARNVTVVRRGHREWFFFFEAETPLGKPTRYALRTQRGGPRTWADPRSLFDFLHRRYGVTRGSFLLHEASDEPNS